MVSATRVSNLDESDGEVWAANLGEFKIASMADAPPLKAVLVTGGKGLGRWQVSK